MISSCSPYIHFIYMQLLWWSDDLILQSVHSLHLHAVTLMIWWSQPAVRTVTSFTCSYFDDLMISSCSLYIHFIYMQLLWWSNDLILQSVHPLHLHAVTLMIWWSHPAVCTFTSFTCSYFDDLMISTCSPYIHFIYMQLLWWSDDLNLQSVQSLHLHAVTLMIWWSQPAVRTVTSFTCSYFDDLMISSCSPYIHFIFILSTFFLLLFSLVTILNVFHDTHNYYTHVFFSLWLQYWSPCTTMLQFSFVFQGIILLVLSVWSFDGYDSYMCNTGLSDSCYFFLLLDATDTSH